MGAEKILGAFPKCPQCGSEETISQKAYMETGVEPQDGIMALEKMIVSIGQLKILGGPIDGVMVCYDICSGCGLRRCVLAKLATINTRVTGPFGRG